MDILVLIVLVICTFFQMYVQKKNNKSLKKIADKLTFVASICAILLVVFKIVSLFNK